MNMGYPALTTTGETVEIVRKDVADGDLESFTDEYGNVYKRSDQALVLEKIADAPAPAEEPEPKDDEPVVEDPDPADDEPVEDLDFSLDDDDVDDLDLDLEPEDDDQP